MYFLRYRDRYGPGGSTQVSIGPVFHAEHVFEVLHTLKPHHSVENLQYWSLAVHESDTQTALSLPRRFMFFDTTISLKRARK